MSRLKWGHTPLPSQPYEWRQVEPFGEESGECPHFTESRVLVPREFGLSHFRGKVAGRSMIVTVIVASEGVGLLGSLEHAIVGLAEALERLDAARPEDVASVAPAVADDLCLRREHAAGLMRQRPEAAWVLLAHRDGHVRELALRVLEAPPTSSSRVIALCLRLNDWVPHVRRVAFEVARRLFKATAPDLIGAAAPYLLRQRFEWRRWAEEAGALDEALARPDVVAMLSRQLMEGRVGPLGRILTYALRLPSIDAHLTDLARDARLATVRAVALKALVQACARWPVGYGWTWIDKTYGLRRRVLILESRPITAPEPVSLIRQGLADRSALVRRVAADALVARRAEIVDCRVMAGELIQDRDAAVRTRAEFILKEGSA